MARQFLIRSDKYDEIEIVAEIAAREAELYSYDVNIASYTGQLATLNKQLPQEWPAHLIQYKGAPNEHMFKLASTQQEAHVVSMLNHRDRIELLLFTEQAERAKTELAYNYAVSKLPRNLKDKQNIFDRYMAKQNQ